MELPKRARTADWENGVLTLDGEKKFEIPELTMELMERLAGYTLVGFHVKDYPATDELLIPFAGHKSMANFAICCWTAIPPFTAAACPPCKAASWTF